MAAYTKHGYLVSNFYLSQNEPTPQNNRHENPDLNLAERDNKYRVHLRVPTVEMDVPHFKQRKSQTRYQSLFTL